jgi:hypothetical protein
MHLRVRLGPQVSASSPQKSSEPRRKPVGMGAAVDRRFTHSPMSRPYRAPHQQFLPCPLTAVLGGFSGCGGGTVGGGSRCHTQQPHVGVLTLRYDGRCRRVCVSVMRTRSRRRRSAVGNRSYGRRDDAPHRSSRYQGRVPLNHFFLLHFAFCLLAPNHSR